MKPYSVCVIIGCAGIMCQLHYSMLIFDYFASCYNACRPSSIYAVLHQHDVYSTAKIRSDSYVASTHSYPCSSVHGLELRCDASQNPANRMIPLWSAVTPAAINPLAPLPPVSHQPLTKTRRWPPRTKRPPTPPPSRSLPSQPCAWPLSATPLKAVMQNLA